jgi:preprotein translocase subunit YajC
MEELIIIFVLSTIVYGFYRLKKHSDKVRQQMMDEIEDDEQ